jgi:hypothetical protein
MLHYDLQFSKLNFISRLGRFIWLQAKFGDATHSKQNASNIVPAFLFHETVKPIAARQKHAKWKG